MPVDWRLKRVNDSTATSPVFDDDLLDVQLVDAFNRFAREATVPLDDPDGNKDAVYPQYEPVELEYRIPDLATGWIRRFGGYVADRTEKEDSTELGCLSYDAFLRGRSVSRGYSAQTLKYILNDLITDSEVTPVAWATGANVTISNNPTITREWQGEPLDVVIDEIASMASSGDDPHEWGANDDNEFFFRPRSTNDSPRDFLPAGYWELKLNQSGREEANRAKVFYGDVSADGTTDNRDAVQLDRGSDQTDAQDRLGTSAPVIQPISKNYPQIANEDAARKKGRDLLNQNASRLTGTLRTYEAIGVSPGDVARFKNDARGIDTQVRIAQLEYRWKADETTVKFAENTAGVLDALVKISDEVSRLDARGQDSTATANRSIDDVVDGEVEVALRIEKYAPGGIFKAGDPGGGFGDPAVGGQPLGDAAKQKIETVIDEL